MIENVAHGVPTWLTPTLSLPLPDAVCRQPNAASEVASRLLASRAELPRHFKRLFRCARKMYRGVAYGEYRQKKSRGCSRAERPGEIRKATRSQLRSQGHQRTAGQCHTTNRSPNDSETTNTPHEQHVKRSVRHSSSTYVGSYALTPSLRHLICCIYQAVCSGVRRTHITVVGPNLGQPTTYEEQVAWRISSTCNKIPQNNRQRIRCTTSLTSGLFAA